MQQLKCGLLFQSRWPDGATSHAHSSSKSFKSHKKAALPQGNRAMPQVFFSVEVRQQHSLQV